ncbi:ribose-phosphate diphosphokinase [Entomohabitans teleogrylli]|uniref:ribose-phosphate diphosphokinase n=1 Tax=Entomohabitans teleogrylli TaxID=1384589 RepID=UPI00073D9F0F|nr:ribose-phosphate diphosphokinase [Entomohabitans teleogrylli]
MNGKLELYLDEQAINIEHGIFPDGAVWLRVAQALPLRARLMRVRATALRDMNDFMLLAQLVEAVSHGCDVGVRHLELPWLPYARQDRHMCPGDSFALRVFAQHLNMLNFHRVIVLDPHSEAAAAAIDRLVAIPQQQCLLQHPGLRAALGKGRLLPVAPDAGALKKIHDVARESGAAEYAIMTKQRDIATGNLSGFRLLAGEVAGRDVLIVDDLCDGGGTFIGSARVLRDAGAHSVSLYVTHGLFSKGVDHLLTQGIDTIYTTTSLSAAAPRHPQVELIGIDAIYRAQGR